MDSTDLANWTLPISMAICIACLQIRQLLHILPSYAYQDGTELPKIDVLTFKGDIMDWRSFRSNLRYPYVLSLGYEANLKKLAHLQHALKDGLSRDAIESLSQDQVTTTMRQWASCKNATIGPIHSLRLMSVQSWTLPL